MPSPRRRRLQITLATLLGLGAALCAGLAWRHRVELFVIPGLWRQVRELAALREAQPEHPEFRPTEAYGLSPFDRILSRLIRLKRPEFKGGKGFEILPLARQDGGTAHIVAYEPLDVPFDAPVDPDRPEIVSWYGDGCDALTLLALDAAGRALGPPLAVRLSEPFGDGRTLLLEGSRDSTSVLRLSGRTECRKCLRGHWQASRILAVDRQGIVDLGFATHRWERLCAPVCNGRFFWKQDADPTVVTALLASTVSGDLHRGLSLLWADGDASVRQVLPLLAHEEPYIRARAAAIAGRDASFALAIAPLLRDPDPRVRFAAIEGAARGPDWERLVAPLLLDCEPAVARRALCELAGSKVPLVRDLARAVLRRLHHPYVEWIDAI